MRGVPACSVNGHRLMRPGDVTAKMAVKVRLLVLTLITLTITVIYTTTIGAGLFFIALLTVI